MPKQDKLDVEFVKKGIKVGASTYRKKVTPPDPTSLLQLSCKELDDILKTQTMKGPEVRVKGNVFIPYAIDTGDYQKIRDAYLKIRLLHPPARHIMCAYILPGPETERHHLNDSCDDGEAGAGAYLLKVMEESGISHKAFFIVRYCGNEKLGGDRLRKYADAADGLLTQKPLNKIINMKQRFQRGLDTQPKQSSRGYKYREPENHDGNTAKNKKSPQWSRRAANKNT